MRTAQPLLLAALALLTILALPCLAQDTDAVPYVGEYELRAEGIAGEMSIRFEDDQMYHVAIFTTTDDGLHFCDFTGRFVQEEMVLVQTSQEEGSLPLVIFDRGDHMEIEEESPGACGLNQTMVGSYFPAEAN